MGRNTKEFKLVMKLGFMGIIGILITIISDFFLIGKSSSAYEFLQTGTESMWDISTLRITIGTFMGVIILPFQALGVVPVYYAIKSSGKILPWIVVITYAHAILMGVAFHMAYAFIGSGWKLHHNPDATQITEGLMQQYDRYWMILMVIMAAELLVSSIIYTIIVAKGNTQFPRWMAIFSPLSVAAFTLPFIFLLPNPIGGYIAPVCLNFSTMIFFILTQVVVTRKAV